MGVAVNIEPAAGKQIAAAEKINHKQPTYYNPVSTRIQDPDDAKAAAKAAPTTYTTETAAAYNAKLPGALPVGDLTPEQAETYNAWAQSQDGPGGTPKGDNVGLTAEEAAAYNAHLDGAVKAGDPIKPATVEP